MATSPSAVRGAASPVPSAQGGSTGGNFILSIYRRMTKIGATSESSSRDYPGQTLPSLRHVNQARPTYEARITAIGDGLRLIMICR